MEALYKVKKIRQGDRTMRAKLKDKTSKSNRADLLDTKRRIPLSEIQADAKDKPVSRMEKLKEWRKLREEARLKKQQEDKKKPPPFRFGPGGSKPIQSQKKSLCSLPQKTTKVTQGSVPNVSSAKKTNTTTSKGTNHNVKTNAVRPVTQQRNPPTTTRSSARLATKRDKEATSNLKPTTVGATRPQTRSQSKALATKRKATSVTAERNSNKVSAQRSKKVVSSQKASFLNPIQEVVPVAEPPVSQPTSEIPTTPQVPVTPAKSYLPVQPSPLLKSQRKTVYAPPFVNHCAWIPNANRTPMSNNEPNFEDAFGSTFSPFKFTAGTTTSKPSDKEFTFTFRKDIPLLETYLMQPDSLSEESSVSDHTMATSDNMTPNSRAIHTASSSTKSNRIVTKCGENDVVIQVLNLNEVDEPMDEESTGVQMEPAIVDCQNEGGVDVGYFRGLHSNVTKKLLELCHEWGMKIAQLEQEEVDGSSDINMEEVLGQIRTTVCQAQLLMRQKLKQYLGLVDDVEKQSGERKTTSEDLQGFWDMVFFQVEDVYRKFDDLSELEKNGWKHKLPTPKKRKTKKRQTASKQATSSSDTAASNERLQAAREKRQAERNRLKEMKLAAKRAREQQQQESVQQLEIETPMDTYATPPKKSKNAHTPRSRSSSKKRRQSQRLVNRSVFSPAQRVDVTMESVCDDVPTAMLLDL